MNMFFFFTGKFKDPTHSRHWIEKDRGISDWGRAIEYHRWSYRLQDAIPFPDLVPLLRLQVPPVLHLHVVLLQHDPLGLLLLGLVHRRQVELDHGGIGVVGFRFSLNTFLESTIFAPTTSSAWTGIILQFKSKLNINHFCFEVGIKNSWKCDFEINCAQSWETALEKSWARTVAPAEKNVNKTNSILPIFRSILKIFSVKNL